MHVWAEISTYFAALLKDLQLLANFLSRRVMTLLSYTVQHTPWYFAEQRANETRNFIKEESLNMFTSPAEVFYTMKDIGKKKKKKAFLNGKLLLCALIISWGSQSHLNIMGSLAIKNFDCRKCAWWKHLPEKLKYHTFKFLFSVWNTQSLPV